MKKMTLLFVVLLLCLFVEGPCANAENKVLSDSDKQELQYLIKIEEAYQNISSDYLYFTDNPDMYTASQVHDLYIEQIAKSVDPEPSRKKPLNNYYMQKVYESFEKNMSSMIAILGLYDSLYHFEITPARFKASMGIDFDMFKEQMNELGYNLDMLKKYLRGEID